MALADSYARHAHSPATVSGLKSAGAPGDMSPGIGQVPSARPQNRAQNTAMQYQRAQVETASPTRLIIMLHEGAIRFCQIALDAMARKDLNAQHINLLKAQRIIAHLLASLNHEKGGEVAKSLSTLYPPMHDKLVNANRHDQPEAVREVQDTLRSLCESWLEVERLVSGGEEGAAAQGNSVPPSQPSVTPSSLSRSTGTSSAPAAGRPVSRLGDRNA